MQVFWRDEAAMTVREVLDRLDKPVAYTTAITVIERLRGKEWLRRERDGRSFRYEAVHDASDYAARLMSGVLDEVDDRGAALLNFAGQLSTEEAAQLRHALDESESS